MARNLKDAFYNAQFRVGQGIFTRAVSQGDNSLTESNFTGLQTFDAVLDDVDAVGEYSNSELSLVDVSTSEIGMEKVGDRDTAINGLIGNTNALNTLVDSNSGMSGIVKSQNGMTEVAASQTAMDAVVASQLALDTVVGSQTAMNAVVASQTAMDAVAASQTARDVIGFSGLAYDTIANSNLAIGKYAIGYTTESPSDFADMDAVAASQTAMDAVTASQLALDTVVASQTAMDAVAASQTAMNAVAASQTGRTTILESQFIDSLWSNSTGSQAYWDGFESEITSIDTNPFTINFPTNSLGGVDLEVVNSGRGADETGFAGRTYNLDLSNISQLTVFTTGSNFESSCPLVLQIEGSNVLEVNSSHSDVERNIDVSSYSGTQEVGFGLEYQGPTGSETTVVHSRIELS